MTWEDISIGDKFRVRAWEDMACEFGIAEFLSEAAIKGPKDAPLFIGEMKEYCDEVITISYIDKYNRLSIQEDNYNFWWHPYMLERLTDTIAYWLQKGVKI